MDCPMKMCDWLSVGSCLAGWIGVFSFLIGAWSLLSPAKSIGFYIWIMAKFNWTVRPIDEARELRNTRFGGLMLVLLSMIIFFNMWMGQCHGVCPIRY